MKREIIYRAILVAVLLGSGYFMIRPFLHQTASNTSTLQQTSSLAPLVINTNLPVPVTNETISSVNANAAPVATISVVVPMKDFLTRVTKKPFGIYITPKTSPIQPEKFTGYHTGADGETTAAESTIDVPIYSIGDGTVVFAGHVNGYGGVLMIRSTINKETVTILYGHLRLTSFQVKNGQAVKMGAQIAVLGTGYSSETDGERKHLHLGIIKGAVINYKGYVQQKSDLSGWDDPVAWLTSHGAV